MHVIPTKNTFEHCTAKAGGRPGIGKWRHATEAILLKSSGSLQTAAAPIPEDSEGASGASPKFSGKSQSRSRSSLPVHSTYRCNVVNISHSVDVNLANAVC